MVGFPNASDFTNRHTPYCLLPTIAALQQACEARHSEARGPFSPNKELKTYAVEKFQNVQLPADFTEKHPFNEHDRLLTELPSHLWLKVATHLALTDLANLSSCSQTLRQIMTQILTLYQTRHHELFNFPTELLTPQTHRYTLKTLEADITQDFKIETLLKMTDWTFFNEAIDNPLTNPPQILEEGLKKGITHYSPLAFLHMLYTIQKSYEISLCELSRLRGTRDKSPRLIIRNYLEITHLFRRNLKTCNTASNYVGYLEGLLLTVPPMIEGLRFTTKLDLAGNHLITLPPQIGALTRLEVLVLSNNLLVRVPEEIGQCTSLTVLNLYHNRLQTCPNSLSHCTNLTRLNMAENQLSDWPVQVMNLTRLDALGLAINPCQTKKAPEDFAKFMKTINEKFQPRKSHSDFT